MNVIKALFLCVFVLISIPVHAKQLEITLTWGRPPGDISDVTGYRIYICDRPLNSKLECEGTRMRYKVQGKDTLKTTVKYDTGNRGKGRIYARATAIDEVGNQSDASNQTSMAFGDKVPPGAIVIRTMQIIEE